jgi:ABC-type branched-subunit amino acid transport system ATPase component
MSEGEPLVKLRSVVKDYRSLRPLRVAALDLHEGQTMALLGFDQAAAEVFVNIVTGAILPDTGEVRVLGQPTAAIADADAWVRTLDQRDAFHAHAEDLREALEGMVSGAIDRIGLHGVKNHHSRQIAALAATPAASLSLVRAAECRRIAECLRVAGALEELAKALAIAARADAGFGEALKDWKAALATIDMLRGSNATLAAEVERVTRQLGQALDQLPAPPPPAICPHGKPWAQMCQSCRTRNTGPRGGAA